MTMLFPKGMKSPRRSKLENITLRDFGGGLDSVDDDISMSPKFQKQLINLRRTTSGSQRLRFGTNWFVDTVGTVSGDSVDMEYFSDTIIAVTEDGELALMDSDGMASP